MNLTSVSTFLGALFTFGLHSNCRLKSEASNMQTCCQEIQLSRSPWKSVGLLKGNWKYIRLTNPTSFSILSHLFFVVISKHVLRTAVKEGTISKEGYEWNGITEDGQLECDRSKLLDPAATNNESQKAGMSDWGESSYPFILARTSHEEQFQRQ